MPGLAGRLDGTLRLVGLAVSIAAVAWVVSAAFSSTIAEVSTDAFVVADPPARVDRFFAGAAGLIPVTFALTGLVTLTVARLVGGKRDRLLAMIGHVLAMSVLSLQLVGAIRGSVLTPGDTTTIALIRAAGVALAGGLVAWAAWPSRTTGSPGGAPPPPAVSGEAS